ncbi:hypothetical protein Ancab_026796 [Ancistrocladus abbreviatus]
MMWRCCCDRWWKWSCGRDGGAGKTIHGAIYDGGAVVVVVVVVVIMVIVSSGELGNWVDDEAFGHLS